MMNEPTFQTALHIGLLVATALNVWVTMRIKIAIQAARMGFQKGLSELREEIGHLELRLDRRVTRIETRLAMDQAERRKDRAHDRGEDTPD